MRRRARKRAAGQSLTELALVLPVFLLIVVVAIDFGRAFFGYVTLTNATRIGANFAAAHPDAWGTPGSATDRATYNDLILADTNTANCDLQLVGGNPPVPTFLDGPDPGTSSTDVGDRADVALSCVFNPLTPIISAIVGSNLSLSANTEFAVRAGTILGVPIAPAVTPGPTPAPTPTPGPGATPTPTPAATPTPTPAPSPTPCPFIIVPSVAGMTPSAANTTIGNAGLTPNGIGDLTTGQKNSATNQSPAAGACVVSGTMVSYHYRPG